MSADSAVLTCIGNDYSFEDVFARQVQALGQPDDILVVFSTSGNSANVLRGLEAARSRQLKSIAFLGRDGGAAASIAMCSIIVPHVDTARVQEGHQFLMHSLMDRIEEDMVRALSGRS
jgi:D-sedoheptulose 7-phosphate isomerase